MEIKFNERALEHDEKNVEHDEGSAVHCENTHPCDGMVALVMTGPDDEQAESKGDGTVVLLLVNGSCAV